MAKTPDIKNVRLLDFKIALTYPVIKIKVAIADSIKALLKLICSESANNKEKKMIRANPTKIY